MNTAWQDWLSVRNQTLVARLIAASALARRESRGAHFRRDFPTPAAGAPISVRVRRGESGPVIATAPVAFTRLTPAGVVNPAMVEIGD
jgi:succinate dehydrogenase/fumarate reductase flavoprotein subunit